MIKKLIRFFVRLVKFFTPHGIVVLIERYYKYGSFKKPWNSNTKRYWNYQYGEVKHDFVLENYEPIPQFIKANKKVTILDLGCGEGGGVNFFSSKIKNAKVSGADFSDHAIKKAQEKYPKNNFFVFDIDKDSLKNKYDYIVTVETLEHITEPLKAINKLLKRVNKSMIVSVPYTKGKTGIVKGGGVHVYMFSDNTFKNYKHKILYKDLLHEGTMPRIIYEIFPK